MDGLKINSALTGSAGKISGEFTIRNPKETLSPEGSQESFADSLKKAVEQVNQAQKESDKKMQDLATGKTDNIAEVMITAEKAELALRLMTQVRNKIVEAYQDVLKMQV